MKHPKDDDRDSNDRGIDVDIGLSIEDLLGGLLDSKRQGDRSTSRRPGTPSGRPGTPRGAGPPDVPEVGTVDARVETIREDEELTIVADLPDLDADDVSVGLSEGPTELVILSENGVVERVPVPWEDVDVTNSTFNNSVLEVTLQQAEDASE